MANDKVMVKVSAAELIGGLEARFIESVGRGVNAWKDAGEALVKLVAIDAANFEKIRAKSGMSAGLLKMFMAIGRGDLLPSLITAPDYVRRLPVADQEKIAAGSVEALVMRPDGQAEVIKVDVLRASSEVLRQVVGKDGLRSLSEQRAVLVGKANAAIAEKTAENVKPLPMPWRVEGHSIIVKKDVTLTRKDLAAMMAAIA